jgi:hypothetical protein
MAAVVAVAIATVIAYAFDLPVRRRLRALVAARSRRGGQDSRGALNS